MTKSLGGTSKKNKKQTTDQNFYIVAREMCKRFYCHFLGDKAKCKEFVRKFLLPQLQQEDL
jgi:hypothetical protein